MSSFELVQLSLWDEEDSVPPGRFPPAQGSVVGLSFAALVLRVQ